MYLFLSAILSCLTGRLFWQHLSRTRRNLFLRLFLTFLLSATTFILLFQISIYFSIYMFQINDPVTW